jgi:glycogen debranching enzyme
VLGDLLERVGDAAGAAEMRRRAAATTAALVSKCFDRERGLFFDLAGLAEERLEVNTVSCLVPLVLSDLPRFAVDALVGHLNDPREYAAPFPVPSVAMNEKGYAPGVVGTKLVWRGPVWMNSNWYVSRGLRRHGHADLARHIEDRSAALVEQSGFREYYHPVTGEGNGAFDFSWTAVVVDMLARLEGDGAAGR